MGKYIPPFNGNPADPNRSFVNADPGAGIEGSIPDAKMWELWQRENQNVITGGGLVTTPFTPNENVNTQMIQTILWLIGNALTGPGSDVKLNQSLFLLKARRAAGVAPRVMGTSYLAWRLNTIIRNTISGASIDNVGGSPSYWITLPAGRYRVFGIAQANRDGQHRCRLYNRTDSVLIDEGTTGDSYANSPNGTTNPSQLETFFELTATKQISFDHVGIGGGSAGDSYFGDSDGGTANTDAYLRILREVGTP